MSRTPPTIDAVLERIRAYVNATGIAKSRLAKDAELADAALRNLHNDDWNPCAATLRKLEKHIPPGFKG